MPALHVILGPQTATKLDEIAQVTEESKTALVHRLIREEWARQRDAYVAPIATSPPRFDPANVGDRGAVFQPASRVAVFDPSDGKRI